MNQRNACVAFSGDHGDDGDYHNDDDDGHHDDHDGEHDYDDYFDGNDDVVLIAMMMAIALMIQ